MSGMAEGSVVVAAAAAAAAAPPLSSSSSAGETSAVVVAPALTEQQMLAPAAKRANNPQEEEGPEQAVVVGASASSNTNKNKKKRRRKNKKKSRNNNNDDDGNPQRGQEKRTAMLSKKERGRLKKLLKRASTVDTGRARSGIESASDWNELTDLLQRSSSSSSVNSGTRKEQQQCHDTLVPRISWKQKTKNSQIKNGSSAAAPSSNSSSSSKTIDAAAHRDLLLQLVLNTDQQPQQEQQQEAKNCSNNNSKAGKKRKREQPNQQSSSLGSLAGCSPAASSSWASVHNPRAVTSVGVVELHVDGTVEAAQWLCARLEQLVRRHQQQRHLLVVPSTTWFQSTRVLPQSIADRLLYQPPPPLSNATTTNEPEIADEGIPHKKLKTGESSSFLNTDPLDALAERMEPLLLTMQQLEQNGYPMVGASVEPNVQENGMDDDDNAPMGTKFDKRNSNELLLCQPVRPQDISLEESTAFVANYQAKTAETFSPNSRLAPFVALKQNNDYTVNQRRQIFAMDAEMVKTTQGRELARVTLVRLTSFDSTKHRNDDKDEVNTDAADSIVTELVFDVLVRPRNTIVNYMTMYSGVTAEMLHGNKYSSEDATATTTATVVRSEQVQAALLRTVRSHDIVIGHSLENDLHATRWIHPTVLDTAVLFRRNQKNCRNNKFSLRHLAAVLLNLQIQKPGEAHCSEEDAVAALRLAVRRAVLGPSFGIHAKVAPTNWLAQLSNNHKGKEKGNVPVVALGSSGWLQRHVLSNESSPNVIHALQCDSVHDGNAKALESWLTGPRRRARVTWASWSLRKPKSTVSDANISASTEPPQTLLWQDVEKLEERMTSLLSKLPSQTVLLIAIQPGYQAADKLTESRRVRRNPKATLGWTESEEDEWRRVVQGCRTGSVLWVSGSRAPPAAGSNAKS